MFEHDEKKYDYKEALSLKRKEAAALAKQHNARQTSVNFVFDTVADAGGFSKAVIQSKEGGKVFKAAESFLYPRGGKDLPKDYSEKCIIL